jgi:BMFP domain-containing protein YqiC
MLDIGAPTGRPIFLPSAPVRSMMLGMTERPDILEKLLSAAGNVLPENIGEDIRNNLRAGMKGVLDDLDVVTREELEVQKKVLLKTREKLEQLESHLKELQDVLLKDTTGEDQE